DPLLLETRTATGAINALAIPVAGVITTGNPLVDRMNIFVPQPLVEALVLTGGHFTHLFVRLRNRDRASVLAEALRERMGDAVGVSTWEEETQDLVDAQKPRQQTMDFLGLGFLLIAATGIANTVLMAAYERTREIGTLRAMGLTKRGVLTLFVTEGLIMGVIGSVVGALLGGGATYYWHVHGLDLTPMMEGSMEGGFENMPLSMMLYMDFSWATIVGSIAFGVVIAVIASVYPARVAANMAPADAVRAD
ncbi:MAG: ABC transporter permease, partial [Deltaproteobacteria bacterium]|nr:ABC transporter permease [Deltaproteobacteria bacterium]